MHVCCTTCVNVFSSDYCDTGRRRQGCMLGCARFRGIEMKRIVLIIFMLLVPASAFAQTDADIDTFRYLASVCRDVDQSKALTSTAFNTGFCLGYLSGVINSMKLIPRVV